MALTKVNSILVDGAINTDAIGNVGIGTSSPAARLHVSGGTRVADSTNSANYITIASGNEAPYGSNSVVAQTNSLTMGSVSSNPVTFITNATERMRIDNSGNLLLGVTSTASIPNGGIGIRPSGGDSYIQIAKNYTVQGSVAYFYNPNGLIGEIRVSGSTTSYVTSSDYRLKENIAPMTGALAKVSALKPVTYNWKVDGSSGQGFIAHELQEVVPDCVTGEKDEADEEGNPRYQGIDTSFLVATLTAAIQEQQAIITDLKARIETLEAK